MDVDAGPTQRLGGDGHGVVYTPVAVAERTARAVAGAWRAGGRPTVLDPACGDGALLDAVLAVSRSDWAGPESTWRRWALSCVRGWDVEASAVAAARARLAARLGVGAAVAASLVEHRDALVPDARDGSWDVVVANPPWIDSSTMMATQPARRAWCAARFRTARGNWDAWCVFAERVVQLAKMGGLQALIVPRTLLAAPYAAAVRRLLWEQAPPTVVADLGSRHGFAASIYPVLCVSRRGGEPGDVQLWGPDGRCQSTRFSGDAAWPWPELEGAPWAGVDAGTLGDNAVVCGAATVSEAYAIAELVADNRRGTGFRMVNSGTVDPGCALWGERPMRYLGRRFLHPVVPVDALAAMSPRRAEQARSPKLIVASMTRRLEVFRDLDGGWLAGKSTTVVMPHRDKDSGWLAAYLDAPLTQRLFRERHGSLAMSGGHLRVGPKALRSLPVPALMPAEKDVLSEMWRHVEARQGVEAARCRADRLLTDAWGRASR